VNSVRPAVATFVLVSASFLGVQAAQAPPAAPARDLFVTVGKSLVVESPVNIQRVSVASAEVAEAVAVTPREILINGKAPGETTLLMWQQGGNRLLFDLHIRPNTSKVDVVRQELAKELPDQDVTVAVEGPNVFVRGTAKDLTSAERAVAIAATIGKPVNLLRVKVPPAEEQVLLRVRFANVDRAAVSELGVNLISTGALNTPASISTGQFNPPRLDISGGQAIATFSDALNVLLFRRDLNLGATIRALQTKRLLEILAEPNVLAINGKKASFLAGGEFPVPVVQSGVGGAGTVTIQWREFGVRINFTPSVTPRRTIRLQVNPEVSSLDFANATTLQGFTIPAISTRRVDTEVELESGQSFAIAGLMDNRVVENLNKIPGLASIPVLGKLFQSRSITKNKTELLVLVTPELVRPIPAGQPVPQVAFPVEFMQEGGKVPPRTPGLESTGNVPVSPSQESIPFESLHQENATPPTYQTAPMQYIPVPYIPQMPAQGQPQTPAPAPAKQ
jgi:pilus assembly protein CpaC